MRYHRPPYEDNVSHLIGQCLRDKAEAKRMYDKLIARNGRKVDLFTGGIELSETEHDEFVARFSAEVEPTLFESKFLKH